MTFLKRKIRIRKGPNVYVVARATANGGPWTVWAVPAQYAVRALHSLETMTIKATRPEALTVAAEANAGEARDRADFERIYQEERQKGDRP